MSRTFNGTSDVITLAASASMNTLGGNLSIMAWIFLTDSTTGHAIFGAGDGGTPILRTDAGLVLEGFVDNNSFTSSTTLPFALALNTWTHVAMTYNDSTDRKVHLYINGSETAYSSQPAVPGPEGYGTGFPTFIGNDIVPEFWKGNLAEIRAYNIALSPSQIAAVAADTTGNPNVGGLASNLVAYLHLCGSTSPEPDASGNGNVGVLTGTTAGPNSPGFSCPVAPPPSGPNVLIPLPFSKRMTTAAAVFACIFIASPMQGVPSLPFVPLIVSMPVFSDNFHRANEEPLNPANWTNVHDASLGATSALGVLNNVCVADATSATGYEVMTGVAISADQYAEATIGAYHNSGSGFSAAVGLAVRGSSSSLGAGYSWLVFTKSDGSNASTLRLSVGSTILSDHTLATVNPGDIIRVEVVGSTITGKYNGAVIVTATRSDFSSGQPGLEVFWDVTQTDTFVSLFTTGNLIHSSVEATTATLQLVYAQLLAVYAVLRHQDTANNQIDLFAAIAQAKTTVATLNTTINSVTASGDALVKLLKMQSVVAQALATLQNIIVDESDLDSGE
jgi:Concanavalin A-like lectin/glucanases superfamily